MRSAKIPIIEYMRGLASLGVAWFHMTNSYGGDWVGATGALGWLGVEVFFVISGFIIPYAIGKPMKVMSYVISRISYCGASLA